MRLASLLSITALLVGAVGCGSPPSEASALRSELVYGSDDRVELFEAEDLARALGASVVALGLRSELSEDAPGSLSVLAPSWRERAGLCEDERFAEQPSFALCTGVAIGTDLVLTAGHCARAAALDELAVVSGFSYESAGQLQLTSAGRVHAVEAVLASDAYWDYAWLRVEAGLAPLPAAHLAPSEVSAGDPVFSINHGGGLPAKVNLGGTAYPLKGDELVTTLDVFGGASGGPVFAHDGNLIGVLTAGSPDYESTSSGCTSVAKSPDLPDAANELAVGLQVPMRAICNVAPGDAALTASCPAPSASRQHPESNGCAMTASRSAPPVWWCCGLAVLCFVRVRRRACRRGTL